MRPTEIHPGAAVAKGAEIGAGVRIGPWCSVGPDAVLEDGVELVGAEGHRPVVPLLHLRAALEQAAVDEEAEVVEREEVFRAGHRPGRAVKADLHRDLQPPS